MTDEVPYLPAYYSVPCRILVQIERCSFFLEAYDEHQPELELASASRD